MRKTLEQKRDEFYQRALDEMFKRVGFDGYDEEFAQQPYWYTLREWTLEEDVNFTKWFIDEYVKSLKAPKYIAKQAAGAFVLNYGWKLRKEFQLDGKFKR
jgi:hypothetical protein